MTSFTTTILTLYGQVGQRWLDELPEISRYFADLWQLGDLVPVTNLSYNAVYFSTGKSAVLKLGLDRDGLVREARALEVYQGQGSVRLLQSDINSGALLIERSLPGISLKSLFPHDDSAAVVHAVAVMKRLHAAPVLDYSLFPTLADWFKAFERESNMPQAHLKRARHFARELLKSSHKSVLLHGDLHHDNVLSQGEGWVAIDPKGVWGDPGYEVGAFMGNPWPDLLDQPHLPDLLSRRIARFAVLLNEDPERLHRWSYVQAVLGACWSVEDNENPDYFLKVASCLEGIGDKGCYHDD